MVTFSSTKQVEFHDLQSATTILLARASPVTTSKPHARGAKCMCLFFWPKNNLIPYQLIGLKQGNYY